MRKFGLCLFYGLCVFTIAFSLFWMALPRLPLPEAPADETPPISGSVSSLVQAAAPTAAGYYLCDTGGRVAVYACNADGTPGALQQLTGIYVNLLPENDVLRIRRGIRVHSLPELQALLEAPADETPPISGSVSSLVQAAAPTAAGYYLCDTGGRVAVYACNADGTPGALQQLTGIYVNLLPENDVLRIRRGIRVHSLPELQALLEDLGG